MTEFTHRCAAFRRLHHAERPLLLPNAWDYASAVALAARGFAAIGTTSLGIAAAAGKPDAMAATRRETLALARSLSRLPSLLTVDIEAGFSDDPRTVADLAADLAMAGAVGINLEDGRPDGTLSEPARHCEKIAAIKDRVPALFVNARTDTFWLPSGNQAPPVEETLARGSAYLAAGADGMFVPGAVGMITIPTLVAAVDAPLNLLYLPGGSTFPALAEMGVARVSCGSLLYRAALRAALDTADTIRRGDQVQQEGLPSYAQIAALTALNQPPSAEAHDLPG